MNRKNNRQYQGSAARMEQALLELMEQTPFPKITVRLICGRAGVNRSTFYAHYTDLYDMIEQMEANLRKELMDGYPVPGAVAPLSRESFLPFLEFIRAHADFYRIALKTRREFPIRQGFDQLWERVVRPLSQKAGITSEQEMLFCFAGFQAAFTTILKCWVEQGCAMEVEQVAEIVRNIVPSVWKNE